MCGPQNTESRIHTAYLLVLVTIASQETCFKVINPRQNQRKYTQYTQLRNATHMHAGYMLLGWNNNLRHS